MHTRPEGMLAEALTKCGVCADAVAVEWDDLCQENVLSFSGDEFSRASLACLAELFLTFPSRFVFASDELQTAFDDAVGQSPAMLTQVAAGRVRRQALLGAHGLADFRRFNADEPSNETLKGFTKTPAQRRTAAASLDQLGSRSRPRPAERWSRLRTFLGRTAARSTLKCSPTKGGKPER